MTERHDSLFCSQRSNAAPRLASWPHGFGPIERGLRPTSKTTPRGNATRATQHYKLCFGNCNPDRACIGFSGCNAAVLGSDQKHAGCCRIGMEHGRADDQKKRNGYARSLISPIPTTINRGSTRFHMHDESSRSITSSVLDKRTFLSILTIRCNGLPSPKTASQSG